MASLSGIHCTMYPALLDRNYLLRSAGIGQKPDRHDHIRRPAENKGQDNYNSHSQRSRSGPVKMRAAVISVALMLLLLLMVKMMMLLSELMIDAVVVSP